MSGIGFGQDGHEKYAGPGHWNDPDMLVVGKVGWGPSLHPTHLKPNEQITHISLWCLLSSPLLIGCDMSSMDKFTVAVLTNDEVLAINQDPLGKPAGRILKNGQTEVWARPLFDGTTAVGLFNRGSQAAKVKVSWSDLKREGPPAGSATCGSTRISASRPTATRPPFRRTGRCSSRWVRNRPPLILRRTQV